MQVAIVFDSWRFLSDAENLGNFTGQVYLSRLSRGGGGKKNLSQDATSRCLCPYQHDQYGNNYDACVQEVLFPTVCKGFQEKVSAVICGSKRKKRTRSKERKRERQEAECEQLCSKKATFGRLVTHMHAALLHYPKELASFFFIR